MKDLEIVERAKRELKAPSNIAFDRKHLSHIDSNAILTSQDLSESFIDETMKHIKTNFKVSCDDLRTIHSILKRGVKMY